METGISEPSIQVVEKVIEELAARNAQVIVWRPIEEAPKGNPQLLLIGTKGRMGFGKWHQPANRKVNGFWASDRVGKLPTHFAIIDRRR